MPSLDKHGQLAAATIVFYVPLVGVAFFLTLRHGFRRDVGWIFLLIFSIIRVVGGIMLVAAEKKTPVETGLYIAAYILEAAGLSPLLLATLGFLGLVGQNAFGELNVTKRVFRLLGLISIVALALSIAGGSDASSDDASTVNQGKTLRRTGVILFLVLYIILFGVHVMCWLRRDGVMLHRRRLLVGISSALPFLGVRLIYSILSTFSSTSLGPGTGTGTGSVNPSLAKFNMFSGSWQIYLVMSLIMEYIVVIIYMVVGTTIPLEADYHVEEQKTPNQSTESYPLNYGRA